MINFTGAWATFLSALGIHSDDDDTQVQRNPLSYAPVWYAINKIGGHVGYLPLDVRKQTGRNIEKDFRHPSYRLFRWQPNSLQGPLQFKRSLTADALLYGNGLAYISRNASGRPIELVPLPSNSMTLKMDRGYKVYQYFIGQDDPIVKKEPAFAGQLLEFSDDEILHIAGLGGNGIWGYPLITLARESWEAGIGNIRKLRSLAKKGYAGGLMLSAPAGTSLSRDASKAKEFLDEFRKEHAGADKAGVIGLLREGVTAEVKAMSQQDAQFVETMRFLRQEEALRFMLESILGDDTSVSYNSLEQKNLAYLQNCLNTWLTAWEEECDRKLLTRSEQDAGYFHKFNVGPLLRSDSATTMRTISMGITSRVLSPNEAREMLDRNPYEGGDEYANPAIEKLGMRDGEPDTEPTRQPQTKSYPQIENMLNVEANRIAAFAKNAKNFIEKVDSFYARWEPKLADVIEKLGGDRDAATWHCDESKELVFELAGASKPNELESKVQALVYTWPMRSADIISQIEVTV